MNILDAEDMIKGLPDQTLMQQAQMPTGELPQFLVISEIQRRSDMRKRHEAQMQEQSQGTVKDQILREGIAAMMPQQPMGMPPQMMPQGMPPQGMPPQGGPQMPPQGMPPGMPPMGMAAGGIVRMQRGGFLDQYVAGAEAGPMPGGSTIRDQLDRLLESGMSYPEILSFVSKTFYGRPEALEYVQSKVGRPEPTMGSGGMGERSPSIDIDASQPKLEYVFPQEGPQAIRESAQRGVKMLSDEMDQRLQAIRESAQIDLGMPTREQGAAADRAAVERIRSQLSPSISGGDIDEAVAGMVTERAPRSGGIPSLSTAPQRGAGGRPFDFNIDLGMPTREQAMMADRAAVAGIRSNLSPSLGSIDASDIDRSIAGMVSERAPRSGGIGRLFGFLNQKGSDYGPFPPGETVGESPFSRLVAEEGPYARQLYDRLDSVEDLTLYGMLTSDDKGAGGAEVQGAGSNVQARGKSAPDITGLGAYQDELLGYKGDFPYRAGRTPDDMERIQALIAANDRRSEELLGAPAVDGPKPGVESADPVSTLLSAASSVQTDSSDPQNRRRSMIDDPVLDLSDIIAQSEKMAKANALMQLGAGIAEGSVAKGISAAGIAATKGMQDARSLEMKKRLAEYQAGREDIRRGEEADRFERKMGMEESQFDERIKVMREEITAKLGISKNANNREVLQSIDNALKAELDPEKRADLLEMRSIMSSILSPELMAIMGQGAPTGAVSFDTLKTG